MQLSMALIVLYAFPHKSGENSLSGTEGAVGAEFPAAEATDASIIVEMQCTASYVDGPGRAGVPAYSAQAAFPFDGIGPGRKMAAQAVFQERGQPPLHIG